MKFIEGSWNYAKIIYNYFKSKKEIGERYLSLFHVKNRQGQGESCVLKVIFQVYVVSQVKGMST